MHANECHIARRQVRHCQRRLDEDGLRRAVRCCEAAGTAGLVAGRACTLCKTLMSAEGRLQNSVLSLGCRLQDSAS